MAIAAIGSSYPSSGAGPSYGNDTTSKIQALEQKLQQLNAEKEKAIAHKDEDAKKKIEKQIQKIEREIQQLQQQEKAKAKEAAPEEEQEDFCKPADRGKHLDIYS